jgi:hypothetical protein
MHESIIAEAVIGPLGGGMDVTQCCTQAAECVNFALLCSAMSGGREMCVRCTSIVYVRDVDRKARWCGGVILSLVL